MIYVVVVRIHFCVFCIVLLSMHFQPSSPRGLHIDPVLIISLLSGFRQLLQIMHHANPVRHSHGDDDAANWRRNILRDNVSRCITVGHHVRSRLSPEAVVDRSDSDNLRGHRGLDGGARLHDFVRRLSGDGRHAT